MIPTELQPMANHLWQSTWFAAVAGLLTLALRKNRAQVRYWLWRVASVKFLVPFSILVSAGKLLGPHKPVAAIAPVPLQPVIEWAGLPLAGTVPAAPMHPSTGNLFPYLVFGIWAIGFLVLICSWWLRWRGLRAEIGRATAVRLPIGIRVISSPAFGEPGVFGILDPVLLLPEGITSQLTPPQLEAILKHELCHVRRHDNLATALHMVVEALFWFHPMVWWLGARMMDERERACDEEVLLLGSEPQVYAEGILRVCELYLESPPQCVAPVTGGELTKRIERIMSNRRLFELSFARKAGLALAGVVAVAIPIILGAQVPQWQTAAGGKMAFEVASVKPDAPGAPFRPPLFPLSNEDAYAATGGRFFGDFPLTVYIEFAYKLWLTREQTQAMLAHMPKWVANDRFVIEAKAPITNPTKDQMRLMMQSLLADRFQLALHFESREVPVLALTLAKPGKTGPKLIPHAEGPPCDATGEELFPFRCEVTALIRRPGSGYHAGSRNTTIELLAAALPSLGNLERPVVDRTGLSGKFDYQLEWIPEPAGSAPPNPVAQAEIEGTTFFQALREQLGLKLESTKGPLRTLVIDHIERPSENWCRRNRLMPHSF